MKNLISKAKKEALKYSLGLVSLIVLIPSLITDYYNFLFFPHYTDPLTFLFTKLLIWFILPIICIFLIFTFFREDHQWLPLIIQFFLIANIYFYISQNVLISLVMGIVLACLIFYIQDILTRVFILPVSISLIIIVVVLFKCFGGITNTRKPDIKTHLNVEQKKDAAILQSIRKGGIRYSIYVILFDELSRNALFSEGHILELFPSFQNLAATALYPPRSTTNYAETNRAIETMMSGRLVPKNYSLYNLFATPTLFDVFPPEKIRVWGTIWPFCRSLRARGMDTVYCREIASMSNNWPIIVALKYDLIRLVHVSLIDFPAAILLKALLYFETEKLDRDERNSGVLIDYLQILLNAKYGSVYLDWIPNDLKKLDDYLESIGTVSNSLYFFNTILPHSPYIADQELNIRSGIKDIAFFHLSLPEEVESVNRNYIKNVQAADTILGLILKQIDKKDPKSIVIVTSDHGVARDPNIPLLRPTGHYIQDVVDIPFFIRLPEDHPLSSTALSCYQHIDFLPTVLHVLGHDVNGHFDGISVFKTAESPFFFSSKGVTFNKPKLSDGKPF